MTKLLSALLIFLSSTVTAQQTFYISSSSGNDANAGTSSAAPRKTIPTLKPRNTYLLKRGDIFYQKIKRVYNPTVGYTITVGAYGTGSKPVLSLYAVISSSAWVLDSTNRWRANFVTFAGITGAVSPLVSTGVDVGFLKLNGKTIKGAKKKTKSSLAAQWDFYSGSTYLYVYSTAKPSSLASKIEAATDNSGISISDNMTVQDIKIMGAGHHGIGTAKQNNIIIRNVEVSEIGGGYLPGGTTRYGNGIQLYDGGSNSLIENCIVKHTYDVAYTMQSASSSGIQVFKNITFRNNTADSCEQSFELAMYNQANQPGYVNCRITGNNFRNAGYSWGHYLRPRIRGVHLLSYFPAGIGTTTQFDLIYEYNTFFRARDGLYYSDYGGTRDVPLPPYKSRNNKIWLDATTYIRMKIAGGATLYPWTVKTYQDFVTKNGKEVGSTWNVIGATANGTSSILITSPENNATISLDSTLKIEANPAELASFARVDFYLGSELIGSDTSSPYMLEVENPGEGSYQLTAKAIGKDSSVSVSTPVAISIKANQKGPSVAITHPANHASFTEPEIINISATVFDSSGSVRTVEFFNGEIRLGVGIAAEQTGNREFKLIWSKPAAGAHTIIAKAINISGEAIISEPIEIKVSTETAFSFTTFSGDTANYGSRLTWATSGNNNVKFFKIQRGKTTAELSDIGEIRPSSDIGHNGEYTFHDNSPVTGKGFYRIVSVDNAGNVIYSVVIALDNARRNSKASPDTKTATAFAREDVQIAPNPVSSVMSIRIQNVKQSEPVTMSVLSLSGVSMKTIKTNNSLTEVDLSSLKPGAYILQTRADGQVINKQFIKL